VPHLFSGFSAKACQLLHATNTEFEAVNVLTDPAVRSAIKEFSKWPTIPQLYVRGEFVGGSDIMKEMFDSGELQTLLASEPAQDQ
jgi:monothiol glutaredoxin